MQAVGEICERFLRVTVLALTVLPVVALRSQNPGDRIFSGIQVFDVNICFSENAYLDTLARRYETGERSYVAASVTIDGATFDSRIKLWSLCGKHSPT